MRDHTLPTHSCFQELTKIFVPFVSVQVGILFENQTNISYITSYLLSAPQHLVTRDNGS